MADIDQLLNKISAGRDGRVLRPVLDAILADITAIRTALVGVTAQIDADSGDTGGDTTYASGNDPAALTTTS